jgi:acyl-coenzyme A thioesterase PaaI-like protein
VEDAPTASEDAPTASEDAPTASEDAPTASEEQHGSTSPAAAGERGGPAQGSDGAARSEPAGPGRGAGAFDGVSGFMGLRWDDPQTVRLQIRPELINAGGLLSGVVTYAMVDYCMGSTLWVHTTAEERIATISISINYVQTAVEGELVCRSVLDRRNRTNAVMRSEISHEDGRLLVTAIGSYTIFSRRRSRSGGSESR